MSSFDEHHEVTKSDQYQYLSNNRWSNTEFVVVMVTVSEKILHFIFLSLVSSVCEKQVLISTFHGNIILPKSYIPKIQA